jgi:hypothetical protein
MNRHFLKARIERIELERRPPPHRLLVVRIWDGASAEEGVALAGVRWPVMVAPEPCATTEEWVGFFAPASGRY